MKRSFQLLLLFFLIISPQIFYGQAKKPKVVLVLSGGGAKGIAHIPTLQVLDSLGIVPDLIIGTSMGGIVGGFYAMGYSGDSIANITSNANWEELLGGKTLLSDVSMEEKSEYKRYMVDLDWVKGKPKMTSALLNDQNLREFFATYAYPVIRINDFDKLPIPYRAMTTDIVNGKELLLRNGSMIVAMRATMSIPTIFEPVEYKNTLLIDGGIMDNFPVDVAKRMGADIIIGSDVGGGMEPKDKLSSMSSVLIQTGMLTSLIKNKKNQELCDILLNHTPNLTYSTGDFTKNGEIYEEGKLAVYEKMDELVALAKKLKKYKQRKPKLPVVKREFTIDSFIFKGISKGNVKLVRSRANLIPHKKHTIEDLKEGIKRSMGTQIFKKITFYPVFHNDRIDIVLEGDEKSNHQLKGSLHYDNYRGIGLFINYTGRNLFKEASRLILSIDVAEDPGFRAQFQNTFGKKDAFWWRSEIMGEKLDQTFFFNGEKAEDMKNGFIQFDNQLNKNLNFMNSYAGFGLNFENTVYKPTVDPDIKDNIFNLERYRFSDLELNVHFMFNTMDHVFYPTKGTRFHVEIARSVYHDVHYEYARNLYPDVSGSTNGFTKLNFSFEHRLKFNKRFTAIMGSSGGFIFLDKEQDDKISFLDYGTGAKYYLGGNLERPRKDNYVFRGLHEAEVIATQFIMVNVALQFTPFGSVIITPHFNIATVGYGGFNDFLQDAATPDGDWQNLYEASILMSGGITASYNSFLGPVDFDVSWVNNINKVRVFFGVGIPLNRSN